MTRTEYDRLIAAADWGALAAVARQFVVARDAGPSADRAAALGATAVPR